MMCELIPQIYSLRVTVSYFWGSDSGYPDMNKEVRETFFVDGGMSINIQ